MIYKPVRGCKLSEQEAQLYGERIEYLFQQHEGRLRREQLVDDARDVTSPLHQAFQWDERLACADAVASGYQFFRHLSVPGNEEVLIREWHLHCASRLMNSICVWKDGPAKRTEIKYAWKPDLWEKRRVGGLRDAELAEFEYVISPEEVE